WDPRRSNRAGSVGQKTNAARSTRQTGRNRGRSAGGHGPQSRPLHPRSAEEMTKVFADIFYFLALLNKHDEAHAKAVSYSGLIDKLVTTEWVLTELADGLASSRHRTMFVQTRQELLADTDAQVIPFEKPL